MNKTKKQLSIPFLTPKSRILVLEIGDAWLKIAALDKRASSAKIVDLEEESIKDSSEVEISQKITAYVKRKNFKPSKVIIIHPGHNLTTRILSLPSTERAEISDIVELQAVKQTPYTREEITIGFDILEWDETGYSRVLLAISQIDVAARYHRIVELSGLYSDEIFLAFEAEKKWSEYMATDTQLKEHEVYVLIDIDANTSNLFIMEGRTVLFVRSLGYGASHLDNPQVLETDFVRDVQRSIESASAELKGGVVSQIYVSGHPKHQAAVVDRLSSALSLPGVFLDLTAEKDKMLSKKLQEKAQTFSSSFVSMVGCAFASDDLKINLIPDEITMRKGLEARAKDLALLGTLLLTFVMLVSGISFEKVYKKNSYLEHLKSQYEDVRQDAEELERLVAKMKLAKEQMNVGQSFLDILHDINEVLPSNIYLTSLQYDAGEKTATIRGISEDMSSVFQFLSTLEAAPNLEQVKTRNVTKRKVDDVDASEFEIVANLVAAESREEEVTR